MQPPDRLLATNIARRALVAALALGVHGAQAAAHAVGPVFGSGWSVAVARGLPPPPPPPPEPEPEPEPALPTPLAAPREPQLEPQLEPPDESVADEPLDAAALRLLTLVPKAVRGNPLLLPVRCEGEVPREVPVLAVLGDGSRTAVRARVVWPVRRTTAADGRWATCGNRLVFESERPKGGADAFLAIEWPAGVRDPARLEVAGQTAEPSWLDPAPDDFLGLLAERASMLVPTGEVEAKFARPDPALPLERFRTSLGAALRGWDDPPSYPAGSPDDLASRASTALWHAALARIAANSPATAVEVAELLVATCGSSESDIGGRPAVAAWIANPAEVASLLSLLLDDQRPLESLVDGVASWLRLRPKVLYWVADDAPDALTLEIANPSSEQQVVRLAWIGLDEPPLAAIVGPGELQQTRIAKPAQVTIDGELVRREGPDILRIECAGYARSISVLPPMVAAGAAGRTFPSFVPALDLAGVSGSTASPAPVPRTTASLRPRLGGWEIFIEAEDLVAPAGDSVEIAGPGGASIVVACDGSVEDRAGVLAGSDGVSFASYEGRYRASFAVPPAWIDRRDGRVVVEIGFRRRIGAACYDAPFAAPPWRGSPRTIPIDILDR